MNRVTWAEIGPHRLARADCLEALKELPDGSVDAVVTDPPYGVGFNYSGTKEVASDPQAYWEWLRPAYREWMRCLKPGGFMAVWNAHKNFRHFWEWFGDEISIYAACKNFVQLRKSAFNLNGFDPVVMAYKPGEKARVPTKRPRSVNFHVANTASVVSDTTRIEKAHPCPRPLDTVVEVVQNFVAEDGTVLDPFMGSGTVAVACEQTGRRFIGSEIDATYFDLACRRVRAALDAAPLFREGA